jgi:hypothetical protein
MCLSDGRPRYPFSATTSIAGSAALPSRRGRAMTFRDGKGSAMSQPDQAWSEVAEQLRTIGSMLKCHYQAQESDARPEPASQEEVKDALRVLGESAVAALGTVGDAVKDLEVKVEVREATGLFLDALGLSVSGLGVDLSKRTRTRESVSRLSSEAAVQSSDSEEQDVQEEGE